MSATLWATGSRRRPKPKPLEVGDPAPPLLVKTLEGQVLSLAELRGIGAALAPYGVPCLVNDRVDLALAGGAEGVHLGQGYERAGDKLAHEQEAPGQGAGE